MKLKLQGPSLAWTPFKALRGVLSVPWKCIETSQVIYIRNVVGDFRNLTTIMKIYMTLPITSCEAARLDQTLLVGKHPKTQ
jgi:hypothetical protein